MNAIDREKLLTWAKQNAAIFFDLESYHDFRNLVLSGAFDIKPHEGRTGQAIRVPGEIEWEDETHD